MLTYLKTGHKTSQEIRDLKDKIDNVTNKAKETYKVIEQQAGGPNADGLSG